MHNCPCCSGLEYEHCCQPFHLGKGVENARQLMRSRFSAYALNLPDYIVATTHPASPQYADNKFSWKRGITQFSKNTLFQNLKILEFKEYQNQAVVTFTAYLSQAGEDTTFTERSYFEKFKGRWLYKGGQLADGHAPSLITTGQFRLLPLAYYGEPILRKKAALIDHISPDIEKLVEEMVETMDACDGVGLAAPQVHHSIRLFVIHQPLPSEERRFSLGPVKVFINPQLSNPSHEKWKAEEGCLSIPALREEVERPCEVTVDYTDLKGAKIQERVSGWEARVIMHEFDHIEGILFTDRLPTKKRNELEPFLKNLEKRLHDHQTF